MLVGRTQELAAISALVARAAGGRGGLAVICGEAGIGKTRLADEIAAAASERGFCVVWGRAWETGGAPAYYSWIEILHGLREIQPELPMRLHALLQERTAFAPGESTISDVDRERFELFDSVTSYLRSVARARPLLLVFDDLHAADLATLELLCFVARALRGTRIAAIATYRDLEARQAPRTDAIARIGREGETFLLRPLSTEEVAEVVRHELGRFDAALSAQLSELTDGNPLFLRETLYTLAAKGASCAGVRELAVADGVISLLGDRLSKTRDATRTKLEAAAVIGREVELALCAEVTGASPTDVAQGFDEAVARGLLERSAEHRYRFTHALVREAVYRSVTAERRRELHLQVSERLHARVLDGRSALLATQAHHALAALPLGDAETAIRTARLAADQARGRFAYEEATELLERALSTCDALDLPARSRVEVLLALGWTRTESGKLEQGRNSFREAAATARQLADAALLARAALGQGGEYVLSEVRPELIAVLREALERLQPDSDEHIRLRARVLARLAAALTPSATPAEPLALAREALAMVADDADTRTRIDVNVGAGAALADFAPPRERIPVNERLRADASAAHDRVLTIRALTRLACDHLERGDVMSADAVIAERKLLSERVGRPRYRWQDPLLQSMRWMPEGRFAECEAAIREARAIAAEAVDPNAQRCIEVHRYSLLLLAGRPEDREESERAVIRELAALPQPAATTAWVSALGAARTGDVERARPGMSLETHPDLAHVITARMARIWSAEIAIAVGDRKACEELYDSFDPADDSTACWGPFALTCWPAIAHYLGELAFALGRPDAARAHAELALRVCERMNARGHRAWVKLGLGRALGSDASARSHLAEALELACELEMPELRAQVERCLQDGPAAVSRSFPRAQPSPPQAPDFRIVDGGDLFTIDHAGKTLRLKSMRGLKMLARLCERPGQEIHALDLVADAVPQGAEADTGDAGAVIDGRARDAYKARIAALREQIDEAEVLADSARAERARDELEALTQQLSAAFGLGGRARRTGSAAERARVSAQRRLREAIRKIAEQDPVLGRHLDWTIRTGLFCAYEPSGRVG